MILLDWMRHTIVDLRPYVPPFLYKQDKENDTLLQTLSEEHEAVRLGELDIQNQISPQTVTSEIQKYEDMFAITPLADDSDAIRKNRILQRYRNKNSSTLAFMLALVNQYGYGEIEEHNDKYYFIVNVDSGRKEVQTYLKEQIELYKPAHLGMIYNVITKLQKSIRVGGANGIVHTYITIPLPKRNDTLQKSIHTGGKILFCRVEYIKE